MADIIHLLPDSVANQIAAGEVIQRPASVVKEMIENSLDAGATEIKIWATDAGKTSLIVADNGKGMSETDARMAFERHATSKISRVDDLYSLHTMGFRGEALPSICAVADVEVKTRTADEELGVCVHLAASKVVEQNPIACPVGTTFTVKNLFFNVPARRKFLKSNQTELGNIVSEFERFALAHPEVRLSLFHNKVPLFQLPSSQRKQRIIDLFGSKMEKNLLPVSVDTPLVRIEGFLGGPSSARKRGAQQYFFVNGRYMRHPYFHRAVVTVLEPLVKSGEQVPYFLYFEVDPSHIDVNIHPTKTEIKFEDEQAIWQILAAGLREALAKASAVPTLDFDGDSLDIPSLDPTRRSAQMPVAAQSSYNPFRNETSAPQHWQKLYDVLDSSPREPLPAEAEAEAPTLASAAPDEEQSQWQERALTHFQYRDRYLFTSVRSGLMVIDVQRAHERILYERFMRQFAEHGAPSQRLMFPEIVPLSPRERITFNALRDDFVHVGFDFSDFKEGSVSVNAVPAGLEGLNATQLLHELVEAVQAETSTLKEEVNRTLAYEMAHRGARIDGLLLSEKEMSALIDDLFACSSPNYTADGKLIVSVIPDERIEALFK